MGQRRGQAFWERVVAEVEAGAPQGDVARRYGVSLSGVRYWVKRSRVHKARPAEARLLPVRVTGVAPVRRCSLLIEAFRFEFDEGTEPAYVAGVARALRAC